MLEQFKQTPLLVLIVEDNTALAANIIESLKEYNIECDYAKNGVQALSLAQLYHFDVIISDILMPAMDGITICKKLRALDITTPILLLTALDHIEDKVTGFSVGADDYLVKPFEMLELIARIRSLSEKKRINPSRLVVEDLQVDLKTYSVTRAGKPIFLSPICWELLVFLMRKSPSLVSKEQIEQHLWKHNGTPETDVTKVHLYRLRQAIDKSFDRPLLHTIRGRGVVLGRRHVEANV